LHPNASLLGFSKQQVLRGRSFNLKYPTGKRVSVKFKVRALEEAEELSMKLPVYVVDMKDDCLLRNNFLSAVNFEETFVSFFDVPSQKKKEKSFCSQIVSEASEVPKFLKELFVRDAGFK